MMVEDEKVLCLPIDVTNIMKGMSICFIIAGHILGGVFDVISVHVQNLLGVGGVVVFLMLSGYGQYCSYRKNKELKFKTYWSNKINKIFGVYALVTVLYYIYLKCTDHSIGMSILVKNVLCIDYDRNIDATMWYMSFLIIWYVAFFLAFYFDIHMILKICFLFFVGYVFSGNHGYEYFSMCNSQFVLHAYGFPVGVFVGYVIDLINKVNKRGTYKKQNLFMLIACLAMSIYALGIFGVVDISYWFYGFLLFFILYGVIYVLIYSLKSRLYLLKKVSKYAFLLYLIEGKLIYILSRYDFISDNIAIYIITFILMSLCTIYIYNISCRLFDKVSKKLEV